jgi:tripartite-type tricarboxylate transporter receptor subunit TctC
MKQGFRLFASDALALSALCAALLLFSEAARAQQPYPSKPIHLIVTTAVGGAADAVARAVADRLSESMRQPVIVENRPGANGGLAAGQVARAAPDGYTLLLLVDSTLTMNPHLNKNLSYDAFRDFAPVSVVTRMPNGLVTNATVKANNVRELISLVKANPGKFNYASMGIGSAAHIGMELFKLMTKTDITHVPYRAATGAMTDVIGGRVNMILIGQSAVRGQMEAQTLRMLGIASRQRSPLLPQIPTMDEAGVPGYEVNSSNVIVAPAKTPPSVIDLLSREVKKAAADPRFISALAPQGMEIVASTPEEMLAAMQADSKKWGDVITTAGITINQ